MQVGTVAVTLFQPKCATGRVSGCLAEGRIREKDLEQRMCLRDLIDLMECGKTYVNVVTECFPNGKIRGQIEPLCPQPRAPICLQRPVPPICELCCKCKNRVCVCKVRNNCGNGIESCPLLLYQRITRNPHNVGCRDDRCFPVFVAQPPCKRKKHKCKKCKKNKCKCK